LIPLRLLANESLKLQAILGSERPWEWNEPMAKVILGMTTSLDGFVADQDGRAQGVSTPTWRRSGAPRI
jgi:hypothetical protein